MPTLGVSADTFERDVIGSVMAIVTFMTASSEAFTALSDDLEVFADANPDITFATIDAEVESGLAAAARIDAIPTVMAFREGSLVFRERGALENETIEQLIDTLRGLDMQEVRRKLAERAHVHPADPCGGGVRSWRRRCNAVRSSSMCERHWRILGPRARSSADAPAHARPGCREPAEERRIHPDCKVGDRSREARLNSWLAWASTP